MADSKKELAALLEKHQSKVIYLDFWASWCLPCRKSFPWMNQIQQKYQDNNFTVISVNLDQDRKLADEFLSKNENDFPVVFDPNGELAKEFKLKGMPSSFIFDKSGQIVRSHVGFFNDKTVSYEKELTSLIFKNEY
ncbi:TlpA family protein disulfide reductase [Catenovulum maritimum]|nr:TlpA disulfide reductase family protein [Catenovulum maritimum]